jgi:hypothetical protein
MVILAIAPRCDGDTGTKKENRSDHFLRLKKL